MRSPYRTHDRECFFKYMPASTAALVLTNRTLRWSSPLLFNDPFDVPRELSFGMAVDDLLQASANRIAQLIEEPPVDRSHFSPVVHLILDMVEASCTTTARAQLAQQLREAEGLQKPSGESLEALREIWRQSLPKFRILCLTESPSHAAMWHHYADQYRGVVLEMKCDDELCSAWLGAKPVTYPREKPLVYTSDGWADLLTLRQEIAIERMLDVAIHTKSPDWSYEAEWRLMSIKREGESGLFGDYGFHSQEISGIYLGPRISENDRAVIAEICSAYPNAKIWNVSIGMSREFHFSAAGGSLKKLLPSD